MTEGFPNNDTLSFKVDTLTRSMAEMHSTLSAINLSLGSLVRLEEQHKGTAQSLDRAFNELRLMEAKREALAIRVAEVERDMPALKELRKWVIAGIGLGLSMLIGSIVSMTLAGDKQQDFMYKLLLQQQQQHGQPQPATS